MRLYIAGKMTGEPHFGFPVFDRYATALRAAGYEVVSPAELDDPEDRERAMQSLDGAPVHYTYGKTHADFLARDLKIIADQIDAIVVLPKWEQSTGARIETFVGWSYGKPVYKWMEWAGAGGRGLVPVPMLTLVQAWARKTDISFRTQHEGDLTAGVLAAVTEGC